MNKKYDAFCSEDKTWNQVHETLRKPYLYDDDLDADPHEKTQIPFSAYYAIRYIHMSEFEDIVSRVHQLIRASFE